MVECAQRCATTTLWWRGYDHILWPLWSLYPRYYVATSCLPLNLNATNLEFASLNEWNISLLEIYFKPWWERSLVGKLMVQIRLLETCSDYLEKCSKEISLVACLYPLLDTAVYISFIDQSKPSSYSASLASQVTLCAAFLYAALKFIIQSWMRFFFSSYIILYTG